MTQITVGPLLYFWSRQDTLALYEQLAGTPVERIYVGETVCTKRRQMAAQDYLWLAEDLRDAGKDVVLSTLALITDGAELEQMSPLLEQSDFLIEANDIGTVQRCADIGRPFVAGPALNVYNLPTLRHLLDAGMVRWIPPVELPRQWLATLLDEAETNGLRARFEVELFAWGYLPLAYSARCFTARSENRPKDQCEKCCINYPDGRVVTTQDNQALLRLNGIQSQSAKRVNLLGEMPTFGPYIDAVRLSPDSLDIVDVIERFAAQRLTPVSVQLAADECNGYWYGEAGMAAVPMS